MGTDFLSEGYAALSQRLAGFSSNYNISVRWNIDVDVPVFNVIYIEPFLDAQNEYTQDQGTHINSRIDGKYKLRIKVPERMGHAVFYNLCDALRQHFFPGGDPIAYSLDDSLDYQQAIVQKEPVIEGDVVEKGNYIEGILNVAFVLSPERT